MFREDYEEVIDRNIRFMNDNTKNGILVNFELAGGIKIPVVPPLEQWNLKKDYKKYLNMCIEREKEIYRQMRKIKDDRMPCIKPFYGIAEHSSFIGGRVIYGGNTSYHEAYLNSWDEYGKLSLREDNENFQLLLNSLTYLKERGEEEGFIATLRGADGPMDIANALRGNEFFIDMYEEKENTKKLLEFCTSAAIWTLNHQKKILGKFHGGIVTGMNMYLPGDSIGHFSEDASALCSATMYKEFGLPYTKKMLDPYDFAMVHIHTMGRHILPAVCSLDKIRIVEITYDPNQPAPIDVYKEYYEYLKDKVVLMKVKTSEVFDNISYFEGKKVILNVCTSSLIEAEEVLASLKSIRYQ